MGTGDYLRHPQGNPVDIMWTYNTDEDEDKCPTVPLSFSAAQLDAIRWTTRP